MNPWTAISEIIARAHPGYGFDTEKIFRAICRTASLNHNQFVSETVIQPNDTVTILSKGNGGS